VRDRPFLTTAGPARHPRSYPRLSLQVLAPHGPRLMPRTRACRRPRACLPRSPLNLKECSGLWSRTPAGVAMICPPRPRTRAGAWCCACGARSSPSAGPRPAPTATGPTAGCEGARRRARSLGQRFEDALC